MTTLWTSRRRIAGISLAARTPGRSWEKTRRFLRLWHEKRGESSPRTSPATHRPARGRHRTLNRQWFERNTGQILTGFNVGCSTQSCAGWPLPWTAWSKPLGRYSSEIHAAVVIHRGRGGRKYMPQLQHNMWSPTPSCQCSRSSPAAANGSRSVSRRIRSTSISSDGEKKFWRCVESGEPLACSALSRRDHGSRRCGRRHERV